jgi:hypothetical protein
VGLRRVNERRPRVPIEALQLAVFFPLLALAAWLAPVPPNATDRDIYETIGRQLIVPDCGSIHCFRPLVPWIVDRFPGPSIVHWKLYAALMNALAGVAVGRLALAFGLTRRGGMLAAALSAFGFGAMFTLYDPHTADPMMFFLGPVLFRELWLGRIALVMVVSSVAVLAKEFGAAPLWMFTIVASLERRWHTALEALVAANAATIVWIVLQLALMLRFQYSYAESASADVLHGGYIKYWLSHMNAASALSALFGVYGPVYLLAGAGLLVGGSQWRRLAIATAPAAALLCYVQQPDRALWNFHFIVVPLAVVVLERAPAFIGWTFVVLFAVANMRLGAQLPVPSSRFALALALVLALVASAQALRRRQADPPVAGLITS